MGMERLLTQTEAAEILALSPVTLEKMRMRGDGPAFLKFGTARSSPVRYAPSALARYIEESSRRSTLDPGPVGPLSRGR